MNTTAALIGVFVAIGAVAWFFRGRSATPTIVRREAEAMVRAKRRVEIDDRVKYIVAFELVGGEVENLDVDPHLFDRVDVGTRGRLVYEETRAVSFT